MRKIKLWWQYKKLLRGIDEMGIYDGRGRGVDVYICDECGAQYYTRYSDKGVTPFTIACRACGHGTMLHRERMSGIPAEWVGVKVHNWVRPTFRQLLRLSSGMQDHVIMGGLVLEDDHLGHE